MKLIDFREFRTSRIVQPVRTKLVIPAFALPISVWTGVSELLGGMALGNQGYFALRYPIAPFGENFILAISWVEDDITRRFKLWDDENAVLLYPVYSGETIGISANLEIWSVDSAENPAADSTELETSELEYPQLGCSTCCTEPDPETLLEVIELIACSTYAYVNPFCTINPINDMCCEIRGAAEPNGNVVAPEGYHYRRWDGTYYQFWYKETGDDANGWVMILQLMP